MNVALLCAGRVFLQRRSYGPPGSPSLSLVFNTGGTWTGRFNAPLTKLANIQIPICCANHYMLCRPKLYTKEAENSSDIGPVSSVKRDVRPSRIPPYRALAQACAPVSPKLLSIGSFPQILTKLPINILNVVYQPIDQKFIHLNQLHQSYALSGDCIA